jgi:hypothetical protein
VISELSIPQDIAEAITEFGQDYKAQDGRIHVRPDGFVYLLNRRHAVIVDMTCKHCHEKGWPCFLDVEPKKKNSACARCRSVNFACGDKKPHTHWIAKNAADVGEAESSNTQHRLETKNDKDLLSAINNLVHRQTAQL